ncbi:hypothetical protein BDV96DRAFT_601675 [Lophiotrema nucula]|uniref:WSC domain-containing protein n=1 Tax=Lophiotrema nucula TaxID=690887 RepID=A0A6A5Z3G6_9PLEO|nr:hypothetical protein BDV96DRAFT_601675 [Lophiotrema nucula]
MASALKRSKAAAAMHLIPLLFLSLLATAIANLLPRQAPQNQFVELNLPGGTFYVGCYTDDVAKRTLYESSYSDDTNTGAKYVSILSHINYLQGLEWSSECWWGFTLAGGTSATDSDCNMVCTDNDNQLCGGPDRLTIYDTNLAVPQQNPGVNGYSCLGCWSDIVSARTLSNTVGVLGGSANMNVDGRTSACNANGFAYSGVEYAGECWCGNRIDNGSAQVSGISLTNGCDMPCNGNLTEFCGGSDRLNLYHTPTRTNLVKEGDF